LRSAGRFTSPTCWATSKASRSRSWFSDHSDNDSGVPMRFLMATIVLCLVISRARPAERALLQEPVAFRVYQRDQTGRADIPVILAPGLDKATLKSARLTGLPARAVRELVDGKFAGVPTGGPYQVNVTVKIGDTQRTLSVGPIFVGDLWVLAGQSNM